MAVGGGEGADEVGVGALEAAVGHDFRCVCVDGPADHHESVFLRLNLSRPVKHMYSLQWTVESDHGSGATHTAKARVRVYRVCC